MIARKAVGWESPQVSDYVNQTAKVRQAGVDNSFLLARFSIANMGSYAKLLGALLILFVVLAVFRGLNSQTRYDIVHMNKEIVAISKDNEQLSLEVAELRSPVRIQTIAKKDLGMTLPDAFVYSSANAKVAKQVENTRPIVD